MVFLLLLCFHEGAHYALVQKFWCTFTPNEWTAKPLDIPPRYPFLRNYEQRRAGKALNDCRTYSTERL